MKLTVGLKGNVASAKRVILEPKEALYEVFIGAPPEISGTGRTGILPTTIDVLNKVNDVATSRGTKLNILINSVTLKPNLHLDDFVNKMESIGVDSFTVANDSILNYLVERRKSSNASYGITLSTFMYITTLDRVMVYSDVLDDRDRIIINQNENRNFPLLKVAVKESKVPIELFANTLCLQNCADNMYNHAEFMASYSNKGLVNDPFLDNCVAKRINDPMLILTSPIIRPEDIHIYEDIGIQFFKLGTRSFATEQTLKAISAYQNRKWDGDIAELNGTVNVDVNKHHPVLNRMLDGMIDELLLGGKNVLNRINVTFK